MSVRTKKEKAVSSSPLDVEGLATAVWASYLMAAFNAKTPYALQKAVSASLNKEFVYQSAQWIGYVAGSRKPWRRLVDDLENQLPGSAALHGHILWKLLKNSRSRPSAAQVLAAVNPKAREAATRVVNNKFPYRREIYLLNALTKMDSLDALACQLALLKKYSRPSKMGPSQAMQKRVENITIATYQTLLIICTRHELFEFSDRLFELVNESHFLPASQISNSVIQVRGGSFFRLVAALQSARSTHSSDWIHARSKATRRMWRAIQGKYGFDFRIALAPEMVPKSTSRNDDARINKLSLKAINWALESISHPKQLPFSLKLPAPKALENY